MHARVPAPAAAGSVIGYSLLPIVLLAALSIPVEMRGFAGAAVKEAIRFGMARGIFSNEAGLGSAPIAHASAHTDHPARQGSIAMLGTFIDKST